MSEYEIELYVVIGEMLRHARLDSGLTLEQVAKKMDLTPKTIQRYESGVRKIRLNVLQDLTDMYGVDYSEFMKNAKAKSIGAEIQPEPNYYFNDETREIAQEIFENRELRSLFDAARDLPPERLRSHIDFIKSLKAQEDKNSDEGC